MGVLIGYFFDTRNAYIIYFVDVYLENGEGKKYETMLRKFIGDVNDSIQRVH